MARNATVAIILKAKDQGSKVVRKFRGGLDSLRSTSDRVKSALFSVNGALTTLGLTLSAGMVTKYIFDANRKFQDLRAVLTTLEGSEEGALRVFEKIKEFAKSTPYEVEDITDAVNRLKGAGVEMSDAFLTSFGDIVAQRPEKSMLDFAMALEDAFTGERERMKEFGMKVRQEGKQVAITFRGQTKVIDDTREAWQAYITELGQMEGVQGTMEGRMATLNGQISNLFDNLFQVAIVIGEQGGLNEELGGVNEKLIDFTGSIKENAAQTAAWVRAFINLGKAIYHTFAMPVRLLFNIGQMVGSALYAVLANFQLFMGQVALAAVRTSNWITDKLNALPGVNFALTDTSALERRVTEFQRTAAEANRGLTDAIAADAKDAMDAVLDLGNSYLNLGQSIKTAAGEHERSQADADWGKTPETGDPPSAGRGSKDPVGDEIKLLREAKELGMSQVDITARAGRLYRAVNAELEVANQAHAEGRDTLEDQVRLTGQLQSILELFDTETVSGGRRGWVFDVGSIIKDATDASWTLNEVIADSLTQTMYGFGDAVSVAFEAWVDGSQSAGEAFAASMLSSLAQVARGFGDLFAGKAIGAMGDALMGDPKGLAAAAQFTLAASAMYALSGGLSGGATLVAGGGGGPEHRAKELGDRGRDGDATLVIQGGVLDMSDPRQARALADAIENLSGRRVIIQGKD